MKISLMEINEGPHQFEIQGDNDTLDLNHMEGCLIQPCDIIGTIALKNSFYFIKGTFSAPLELECSRCLEHYTEHVNGRFSFLSGDKNKNPEDLSDIPAEYFLLHENILTVNTTDNSIDITENIREQIILAIPLKPLCKKDCNGLCSNCGVNLNSTTCHCKKTPIDDRWEKLKEIL